MFRNPEFTRNAWIDLTPRNLIALPLLLVTIFFLAYTVTEEKSFSVLPRLSIVFYFIFTFIWGTRKAAETIVKEVNSNTWSFQIMTPTTPLKMAIGKLFGSTAYVWYGNLICMILYVLSYKIDSNKLRPVPLEELMTNVYIFVLIGFIAHILPLMMSIHSMRWRHFFEHFDLTFFQITGILMWIPIYFAVFSRYRHRVAYWYGDIYTIKALTIIFGLIFLVWCLIALVHLLKTEFGQEPYPFSWFLFIVGLIVVLFGFNNYTSNNVLVRYFGSILTLFVTVCWTYLTLCGESNLAIRPHMIIKYFKTKQYKRLFIMTPRSLMGIPIVIALAVMLTVQFATRDNISSISFSLVVWSIIMFMLRDVCFVYFWSLFSKGEDKESTVIPVFIMLATYAVFPALLSNVGLEIICPVFMPYLYDGVQLNFAQTAALTVVPPTLEFLIALGFLIRGIKKKKAQFEQELKI